MKPLIAFCLFAVALFASIVCCAESPADDTMEFLGYTGYETRRLTLMADNTYLARWDSDTGNKGSASGSWELVGNEIRLTPKSKTGHPMMGGPMRVLILKEGNGHKALLLKQEEDDPKRRKILLFLLEKAKQAASDNAHNAASRAISCSALAAFSDRMPMTAVAKRVVSHMPRVTQEKRMASPRLSRCNDPAGIVDREPLSMPRLFLIAFIFINLIGITSVKGQTSVVKSVAELRKLGISVERLRNDTPMASVQVGSLVESEKAPGEYDHTECVVLSAVVDFDRFVLADTGLLEAVTVVRRNESVKERSIFLVLGKDLPKSYLAFQFNVREGETTKPVRYLFPIELIGGKGNR